MNKLTIVLLVGSFIILASMQGLAEPVAKKSVHRVEVLELFISQQDRSCKEDITALVTLRNKGNVDEVVYAEVVSAKLNINEFSPSMIIQEGRQQTIVIPLTVEKEIIGPYEFEIRLYTNQGIKRLFQTVHFRGCPKPKVTSLITDTNNPPQIKGEKEAEEKSPISLPMIVTLSLIAIIALFSTTFIILVFVKNIKKTS